MPGLVTGGSQRFGKTRAKYPDFEQTASGLQFKDVKEGEGTPPAKGDRVVLDWEGYTIGYYGRIFEKKSGVVKGSAFADNVYNDPKLMRFVVGSGSVIPAIDEAVQSMKPGGIRQIVVPPEIGYPMEKDPNHEMVGPKPSTFSGQRSLNFVLENQGLVDKTLLFNLKLLRVDASRKLAGLSF
ncbi:unnamed protein product [Vitrella brassicaformis CCMP3155]|uniref:peptidylprolyl isomerase n=2 Tax=Vitrella brassicaformis TaxID=1169539 RepID=A0A0G4END1_VITBC|nr:unnamed protein product [Vitrella brassicaformis CCMP3155]|eukprot:CEL98502.1 unnamed protein product [Vitrella brassicaformis CCMP3155]